MKPIVLVTGDLLPEQPAGLAPTDLLFTTPLPISNVCVFSIRFEISLRSACVDITASILTNKHPLITKFALNRVIRPGFVVLPAWWVHKCHRYGGKPIRRDTTIAVRTYRYLSSQEQKANKLSNHPFVKHLRTKTGVSLVPSESVNFGPRDYLMRW